MIRKNLLLILVVFTTTMAYAQKEKLTQNSFFIHSSFYSYPNEAAAINNTRGTNPKFVEISDLYYTTLKSGDNFTLSLINENINSNKWHIVSRANSINSQGDNTIIFRGTINLKKHASFREVFLNIGAASSSSRIYINGKVVGVSYDSKATIEYDITDYLKEGINNLAIVCFSEGSPIERKDGVVGIASMVDVYTKIKVHISDMKYNTTISQGGSLALIESQVTLKSHLLNKKSFRLEYKLFSQEGELIDRGFVDSDIEMKATRTFPFLSTLKSPKLWTPNTPYLYTILFSIHQEGRINEVVRQDIGIRNYISQSDSLSVVTLTPNLSHSADQAQATADMIRSVGINTIISNIPMNDIYLTACDKAGLFVVDLINIDNTSSGASLLVGGSLANDPSWLPNHLERVERQVKTNGSHTSVIAWQLTAGGANGYNIYEAYLHAKNIEKHRPIINRHANGEWNSDSFIALEKGMVGAWIDGDMLTSNGGLSEKAYKMMEAQAPVYIRPVNIPQGVFKIINNTTDSLAINDLTYKICVNNIPTKDGVIDKCIEPNSFIEYTIDKYNDIPLTMQVKYSQQLRFGKKYKIEIFNKGNKIYQVVTDYSVTH